MFKISANISVTITNEEKSHHKGDPSFFQMLKGKYFRQKYIQRNQYLSNFNLHHHQNLTIIQSPKDVLLKPNGSHLTIVNKAGTFFTPRKPIVPAVSTLGVNM